MKPAVCQGLSCDGKTDARRHIPHVPFNGLGLEVCSVALKSICAAVRAAFKGDPGAFGESGGPAQYRKPLWASERFTKDMRV